MGRADEGEEEVGGALGVGRGGEDRALVAFQDLEPAGDVGGVILADVGSELELGADEGGPELGDEFFGCIGGIAAARAAEVAIEPALVPCPIGLLPVLWTLS